MCPPALYRLCLAILYVRLPALGCCGRLCLAILCLPALDVASSSFDFEKHKLFGVYGGVICLPGWVLVVGFSAGLSPTSLFICLPGPLVLVSALFRWPCSISIHHLSPRSVTCGVRPFPLARQHFYSFVSQVCHCWCPPFSAGFSAGHVAFRFICFPGLSLVLPPFSAGHVAFLFICLPCDFFLFAALVFSALSAGTGSPVKGSCYFERGA